MYVNEYLIAELKEFIEQSTIKWKTVESFDTRLLYFEIKILVFCKFERAKTNTCSHKFAYTFIIMYVLLIKYFLLSIDLGHTK